MKVVSSFQALKFRVLLQRFQTHEDGVDALTDPILFLVCNPREQERGLVGMISQQELTDPVSLL